MTIVKPMLLSKMERGSAQYFRALERMLEQMVRQAGAEIGVVDGENIPEITTAQTTADTGVTNAATAQTDLEANNVTVEPLSQLITSDTTPTWPGDSTTDHVLTFLRQGVSIATHTIRAVWTNSTAVWTVTSFAESGEATDETITGSGGRDAKAVVSHTLSGVVGKVTLQASDISTFGASPSK